MRIGMILDKTFPPDPRVENEAISLINAGHQVFLFCLKYSKKPTHENINGIEVKRYLSNKITYKLSALVFTVPFYTWIMSKKIRHFLRANKIEAIHVHDIQIAEAVLRSNRQKLPWILDLHDNMPENIRYYPHLQKFPGKQLISLQKWKQKEKEIIEKATKICTVSQEFVDEILGRINILREKIVLVPNTVLASFYLSALQDSSIINKYKDDFVVLYLGDTALRRGLLTAIESLLFLKEDIPNLKLVIVGSNTTDYVLRQKVKENGLEEFVDFEGWKDVRLFPSYIQSSEVCISPLDRNVQHDVAYANKLFQYMSFGKPLVVSDAIAQRKLIERLNSGCVHKEKDSQDLAQKILKLYKDANLRLELGRNGKTFIENEFHWEKTSQNLIDLYANLDG
jgi:glycosyltransferase involved in cell wall biosynthesis